MLHNIQDTTEQIKKYNFSSIITTEDNNTAVGIIKEIIAGGNYFENSPKYQTKENIFARQEAVWLKYRMSFLMSVFMYIGREARVANMNAWSFMTNLDGAEDRANLWHHHQKGTDNSKISGIFYLQIPSDVADKRTCGTEMALDGPEGDNKVFITPEDFAWTIYPSGTWHRPGIVQSDNYRFIIAADIEIL